MSHTPEKWYVGYDQEYDIDMLEALEEVMGELDVEGLPCPMCGRDFTIAPFRGIAPGREGAK